MYESVGVVECVVGCVCVSVVVVVGIVRLCVYVCGSARVCVCEKDGTYVPIGYVCR